VIQHPWSPNSHKCFPDEALHRAEVSESRWRDSTDGLCLTLPETEFLRFWTKSGESNQIYCFGLIADRAGAGTDVETAVAAPGRACGAVLEDEGGMGMN